MPGVAITALTDNADAVAVGSVGGVAISRLTGFNGSTWDRLRTLDATSGQGLGRLTVVPAMPGASEVKSLHYRTSSNSSTRATVLTPTSGKKVRIIAAIGAANSNSDNRLEVYFGTGTNITTTAANAIYFGQQDRIGTGTAAIIGPDGGGPIGAVDAVVSIRTEADEADNVDLVLWYREE